LIGVIVFGIAIGRYQYRSESCSILLIDITPPRGYSVATTAELFQKQNNGSAWLTGL
jgi:hypothetical protein